MKRHVVVDGKVREFDLPDAGTVFVQPGVYSVLIGERSHEVRIVEGRESLDVAVNGRAMEMRLFDPREASIGPNAAEQPGRRDVKAPMPGKVVCVLVEVGDAVVPGQGLVVVEAMKMQNEVKSPKTGRVINIAARAGATVAAGDVLVTLE
jgi:biotin carboxyl carrier protein